MKGQFWIDLAGDLQDPKFLREYAKQSLRIAALDDAANAPLEVGDVFPSPISIGDVQRSAATPGHVIYVTADTNTTPRMRHIANGSAARVVCKCGWWTWKLPRYRTRLALHLINAGLSFPPRSPSSTPSPGDYYINANGRFVYWTGGVWRVMGWLPEKGETQDAAGIGQ